MSYVRPRRRSCSICRLTASSRSGVRCTSSDVMASPPPSGLSGSPRGRRNHLLRTECATPTPGESKYNSVRADVDAIGWTKYHFFRPNCQHWVSEVLRAQE